MAAGLAFLAVCGLAGWAAFRRAWWGLMLLVLALPFDRPFELGFTVYTLEGLLAAVLLGWGAAQWQQRRRLSWDLVLASLPFLLALLLSAFNAHAFSPVMKQTLRWLEWVLAIWFASQALRSAQEARWVAMGLVFMAALAAIFGLVQTAAGPQAGMNAGQDLFTLGQGSVMRAYSTFGHPNQFAAYLIVVIPMAFAIVVSSTKEGGAGAERLRSRLAWGAILGVLLAALACTFSRGAWLGAVIGYGVAVLLCVRWTRQTALRAALLAAAAVALLAVVFHFGPWPRLRGAAYVRLVSLVQPHQDDSAHFRQVCVQTALAMTRRHFWLGFGAGEYDRNIRGYFDEKYYAWEAINKHLHNLYLQVLVESGVLGLASFLALLAYYLTVLAQSGRGPAAGWEGLLVGAALAGSLALLIHNFFDVLTAYGRGLPMGLTLGLGLAVRRWQKTQESNSV
jgi:putative inorganic carbon (hco3(-)) transporter